MKRFIFVLGIFALVLVGTARVYSQTGEPPGLDLPIGDESATATVSSSVEATESASASATVSATASQTALVAVDDAETGTQIIILAILSLVGGLGLLSIKKYFDSKKFSI